MDMANQDPGEREWVNLALAQAAWRDDEQAVRKLLDGGADPNSTMDISAGIPTWPSRWTRDPRSHSEMALRTPLMLACGAGALKAARALAERADVLARAPKGWMGERERSSSMGEGSDSALDCAARARSMEGVELLLWAMQKRGAGREDSVVQERVWRACASAAGVLWVEGCERLAREGMGAGQRQRQLNAMCNQEWPSRAWTSPSGMALRALGREAIHRGWDQGGDWAGKERAAQAILAAVEGGDDWGARGNDGMSPLGLAAWLGLPGMCRWMLERQPALGKRGGATALHELLWTPKRSDWGEAGLDRVREALAVLAGGCDAAAKSKLGRTALMEACKADLLWAVEALLPLSDPMARDGEGKSAIELAKNGSPVQQRMRLFFKQRRSLLEREQLGAACEPAAAKKRPGL